MKIEWKTIKFYRFHLQHFAKYIAYFSLRKKKSLCCQRDKKQRKVEEKNGTKLQHTKIEKHLN